MKCGMIVELTSRINMELVKEIEVFVMLGKGIVQAVLQHRLYGGECRLAFTCNETDYKSTTHALSQDPGAKLSSLCVKASDLPK